jgi:hypothetical protein
VHQELSKIWYYRDEMSKIFSGEIYQKRREASECHWKWSCDERPANIYGKDEVQSLKRAANGNNGGYGL